MMKIMAVRDRAVDAYGVPMFVAAIGQAIRSFSDEVNRADSPMGAHAEDYDMYHIGDYDEVSGLLHPLGAPKMVAVGKDLKLKTPA